MELEKLLPKWNCPRCGDWFHMPYKFCACNTRRPQSEQKILPGQTKFIGDYDITNLGKSVVYVGKVGRKMNILDELERLSKDATPGPWRVDEETAFNRILSECGHNVADVGPNRHFSQGKTTCGHNAKLITTMRNNIEALIEAARCLEHVVGFSHLTPGGSTHKWATDILEKLK